MIILAICIVCGTQEIVKNKYLVSDQEAPKKLAKRLFKAFYESYTGTKYSESMVVTEYETHWSFYHAGHRIDFQWSTEEMEANK